MAHLGSAKFASFFDTKRLRGGKEKTCALAGRARTSVKCIHDNWRNDHLRFDPLLYPHIQKTVLKQFMIAAVGRN